MSQDTNPYLQTLQSMSKREWKINNVRAVNALKENIKNIDRLMFNSVQDMHSVAHKEDFIQEALLAGWSAIKTKLKTDVTSKKWSQREWGAYISHIMSSAIIRFDESVTSHFATPKRIFLALRKLERIINILAAALHLEKDQILYTPEFIAMVKYTCPPSGWCSHESCILGWDECPLPVKRLSATNAQCLEKWITGPGGFTIKARHNKQDYSTFIELLCTAYHYKQIIYDDQIEIEDSLDLERITELSLLKDKLGFIKVLDETGNIQTLSVFDVYLTDIYYANEKELLDDEHLQAPTGWRMKILNETYNLDGNIISYILNSGDKIINRLRSEHGLNTLKRS
jgi:hypothetical protein